MVCICKTLDGVADGVVHLYGMSHQFGKLLKTFSATVELGVSIYCTRIATISHLAGIRFEFSQPKLNEFREWKMREN